ncbi:eukaryotic translation initiation factor 2D-like [Mustela nigripes]|uniref:eukaryotic translation initiation factor 2D-like n=1 Tax=Mustela nigripes TaxID=77151 RepID=UPI0028159E21|nr:eukaryotic translation initiation factor 2D-like [Mustela nigripes]
MSGPGFQPSLFSKWDATWLRTGLRVGKSPRSGFPDSPRLLCAPCLPQEKARADVAAAFPTLGTDQVSALVPGKEELNVVKLYAHRGDAVTVYVCAGNPILFELEKNLYPTAVVLS